MTTTDNFTEAASAAAEEQWTRDLAPSHPLPGPRRMDRRIGFTMGAEWARDHLAAQEDDGHDGWCGCGCQDAQEPTDAEVEAAATAGLDAVSPTWRATMSRPAEDDLEFTRAALIRARAARRDEEKR